MTAYEMRISDWSSDVCSSDLAGVDEVRASIDFVLGSNVEDLRLMDGAVSGAANDLANVIRGNDAHNVLKAMGGDDLVYGGAGNDAIDGDRKSTRLNSSH